MGSLNVMDLDRAGPGSVVVIGAPFDRSSTFLPGAAQAPARIREFLHGGSMNLCAEDGTELRGCERFLDLGDLEASGDGAAERRRLEETAAEVLHRGAHLFCLGGDHAVTYPLVKACKPRFQPLTVLHVDAHPDLYDEYDGERFSHASPLARIMEEAPRPRLIQVGIRAANAHQRQQAERFGAEVHEMRDGVPAAIHGLSGPLYLSIDIDALDPAYAPGVSHPEPGGLTTRELIRLVQGLDAPIVGADLVELNPARDPTGITVAAAAKLLKEIVAAMLRHPRPV